MPMVYKHFVNKWEYLQTSRIFKRCFIQCPGIVSLENRDILLKLYCVIWGIVIELIEVLYIKKGCYLMSYSNILNMTDQELIDSSAKIMGFEMSDYLPQRKYKKYWFPTTNIKDAMDLQDFIYQNDLPGYYIERLKETFGKDRNIVSFVEIMNASPKQRTQAAIMAWYQNH
jgi:hypothetical protein